MMRTLIALLVFFTCTTASQEEETKAPEYGWNHNLVSGLNLTQVAFTDWAQGGDNALAWAFTLDGKSTNDQLKVNWTSRYKFGFGQTRLGSQGIRKTDDKIDLETVLTYKVDTLVNPYAAATFKSQFAVGKKYDNLGNETPVSAFFDPAYLTQSVGVGYHPIPEVKTRLGAGLREVFTSKYPGYADDPKTGELEKTRIDGGLESVTEVEWKLDTNILFTSKLELFAPFKTLDEIILRSDNTLSAKVNEYINVNLNAQFINEKVVSPRTQIKETLAIGLTYSIL